MDGTPDPGSKPNAGRKRRVTMKKQGVITFKADGDMLEALERIPNKSEFIRAAVLSALDESCPLCGGTGTLNPHQRMHWRHFLKEHTLIRCQTCNGFEINCTQCHSSGDSLRGKKKQRGSQASPDSPLSSCRRGIPEAGETAGKTTGKTAGEREKKSRREEVQAGRQILS